MLRLAGVGWEGLICGLDGTLTWVCAGWGSIRWMDCSEWSLMFAEIWCWGCEYVWFWMFVSDEFGIWEFCGWRLWFYREEGSWGIWRLLIGREEEELLYLKLRSFVRFLNELLGETPLISANSTPFSYFFISPFVSFSNSSGKILLFPIRWLGIWDEFPKLFAGSPSFCACSFAWAVIACWMIFATLGVFNFEAGNWLGFSMEMFARMETSLFLEVAPC